ncbi:hypothetical protein CANTEDRAFT_113677, partial [Yamadazyma tenuis ATCC 10573]
MFDDMLTAFDEKLERVGRKNTIKPKTLTITEPFLKDDELTRDQIEDQQLKDKLLYPLSRSNSDEYIDENLQFLKEELIWPIDTVADVKSFRSVEEPAKPVESNESNESNESEEVIGGEEDVFFIDKEQLNNLFN